MAAKKSETTTKDVSQVHGTNSIKEQGDQFQVGVTTQENVQNLLASLKQKDTFKDDDGNEINFQGELKDVFI